MWKECLLPQSYNAEMQDVGQFDVGNVGLHEGNNEAFTR